MAENYQIILQNLTDDEFRHKRDELVSMKYKLRTDSTPAVARTTIMEQIASETGLTSRCIRNIIYRSGMPTALPNYKNSGYKKQKAV